MSDISSIGGGSIGPVNRPAQHAAYQAAQRTQEVKPQAGDSVELSEHARYLDMLRNMPDVRTDLIDRIREQIEAGTYETPQRLDAAVEGLAADLTEE